MSIQQKLRVLLAMPGWTQATVAERLGVSQSTVNRWTKGTAPEGDHRDALSELHAEVFGLSTDNNMMRVRGEVGAAQIVRIVDRAEQGWVDRPPSQLVKNLIALRVRGDALQPFFADDWILFHGDPCNPELVVGEIVVAQMSDGTQIVRQLRHGSRPGVWTLTIPSGSDMRDVELELVCPLEWIKPYTSSVAPF